MDNSLESKMELIFLKHKQNHNRIVWTKATFDPSDSPLVDTAAALLEKKGIIYYSSRKHPIVSHLHPDVMACQSYAQANALLEEKKKPLPSQIVTNITGVEGSVFAHSPITQSSVAASESSIRHNTETAPSEKNKPQSITTFIKKLAVKYGFKALWVLLLLLIIFFWRRLTA